MTTRPDDFLNWTPDADPLTVVDPPTLQKNTGWTAGEKPPFEYMNWQMYLIDQWLKYLDQAVFSDVSSLNLDQTMRLINGGTWGYVASTGTLSWSSTANLAIPSATDAKNAINTGNLTVVD